MRVAVYTRASTDEAHQPYSLEAQAKRLDAYVVSQGDWELVRSFSDRISGATLERPALTKALREARAGRFDLLLVYRVDRLARSVRGLAQILEELDTAGVAFRSATEPFDTATPAGRMMVQMLGVFAEFERATIIDRVIAGMERKAAKGGWCGGTIPYGYKLDGDFLVVNEDQAPLVAAIFDRYTRRREGAKAIANWLNERGHRTRSGRPWSHASVITVLRNRVYVGQVHFRGAYHEAPHPPLVDADTFGKAQAILDDRGEHISKRASNSSDYLLGGLIVCTACGKRYVGNAAHGRRYRYSYYTCFSRHRYGPDSCDSERLPAKELDEAVLDALVETYEPHDLLDRIAGDAAARQQAARERQQGELAVVESELAKAEQAVERYLLAFEVGSLPEAQCGERVRTLGAKIAELRDRRTELAEALEGGDLRPPTAQQIANTRQQVLGAIDNGTDRQRKILLQALVHEVRVHGRGRVLPTFRVPFTRGEDTVRTLVGSVGPALHNANHEALVEGPPTALTPRDQVLDAIQARDKLVAGRRHISEAELKQRRRTAGRAHHEADPAATWESR